MSWYKAAKKLEKTFMIPENFDVIDSIYKYDIWGGGGDWEPGVTSIAIRPKKPAYRGEYSQMWFTVKLPEEIKKDSNYDYSKENRDLIAEHGLNAIKEIKKAIKSIKDKKGNSFINYYTIGDAITSKEMKPYVEDYGFDITKWSVSKINYFDKKSFNLKRYTLSEKDDKWSQFPDDVVRYIGKSFGVGPYATVHKTKYHECPKCGEKSLYHKEMHADTDMNYMAKVCANCGEL